MDLYMQLELRRIPTVCTCVAMNTSMLFDTDQTMAMTYKHELKPPAAAAGRLCVFASKSQALLLT